MRRDKVGAPTKFTEETKNKLLVALRKGAPYTHACSYAKISFEIFSQWRSRAKDGESPFVEFFEDIKEAEAQTSLIWLDKIDKAMQDGAWQAAAWKLERRYPETYSTNAPLIKEARKLAELIKEQSNAKDVHKTSN